MARLLWVRVHSLETVTVIRGDILSLVRPRRSVWHSARALLLHLTPAQLGQDRQLRGSQTAGLINMTPFCLILNLSDSRNSVLKFFLV